MSFNVTATCPICNERREFSSQQDYWGCRDELRAPGCPMGPCIVRERAVADVIFNLYGRAGVPALDIHEAAPSPRGISQWLRQNCRRLTRTGYFDKSKFGAMVGDLRNEDLEHQTFADESFDLVVHLDVMEHMFAPLQALREIARTLRPGGRCIFTAPTYPDRFESRQVAFRGASGITIVGEPEYHGNPQNGDGSLVTWRYGYDLPLLIARETVFDVEVVRSYARHKAVLGHMTEVYIALKPPRG